MRRLILCRQQNINGIGIHSQRFSTAIADKLKTSQTIQLEFWDNLYSLQAFRQKMMESQLANEDILVLFGGLSVFKMLGKLPCYTIIFVVWESTILPDSWLEYADFPDEIWVPSRWGKDTLVNNGVPEKNIFIVPEGVDSRVFSPQNTPLPFLDTINGFKFLNIAKAEPRKGVVELLMAFDRAFESDDQVHLVLACNNFLIPHFNSHKFVQNLGLRNRDKIILIQPNSSHDAIARLYCSCDAFVFPTHAEGWGLPVLEAMASGLPVAVTHFSALTEFANTTNSLAIPYHLGPVKDGDLPGFDREDGDYGEWAIPDTEKLAEILRTIFENSKDIQGMGERARTEACKWTWKNAAEIALLRINKILNIT